MALYLGKESFECDTESVYIPGAECGDCGDVGQQVATLQQEVRNLKTSKQDVMTSGNGISILNNVISLVGNIFTNTLKSKLDNIESGAQKNVQSDWDEENSSDDSYIKNKPDIYTKQEINEMMEDSGVKTFNGRSGAVTPQQSDYDQYFVTDDELTEELGDYLEKTGDSKDNTVTYTSSDVADDSASAWTSVQALASGETHQSMFGKISKMFKNIRYLYKLLGTTNISSIGDGSVTGALSALNGNLDNVKFLGVNFSKDNPITITYTQFCFMCIGRYSSNVTALATYGGGVAYINNADSQINLSTNNNVITIRLASDATLNREGIIAYK